MPYFIAVYDVNVNRVAKALKLFRRYLTWVQNSVFEGELTDAQFNRLVQESGRLIDAKEDCVIFYRLGDEKYLERSQLGRRTLPPSRFL